MKAICKHCGIEFEKSSGHLNRANKLGVPVFCSKQHFWESRRIERSNEEKKAVKAKYDKEYHKTEKRKASARRYNSSPIGRAMQKRQREKQKQAHLEYCRTPEYRAWKKQYDENYQAKRSFGEFYESGILLKKIAYLVDNREANQLKGTYNKSQKRKRSWLKTQKTNLPQLP